MNDLPIDLTTSVLSPSAFARIIIMLLLITDTGCPSGFIDVSKSHKCYKLITTEMSWSDAGWHCASTYGAHLVFIGTSVEQVALVDLLNSHPGKSEMRSLTLGSSVCFEETLSN